MNSLRVECPSCQQPIEVGLPRRVVRPVFVFVLAAAAFLAGWSYSIMPTRPQGGAQFVVPLAFILEDGRELAELSNRFAGIEVSTGDLEAVERNFSPLSPGFKGQMDAFWNLKCEAVTQAVGEQLASLGLRVANIIDLQEAQAIAVNQSRAERILNLHSIARETRTVTDALDDAGEEKRIAFKRQVAARLEEINRREEGEPEALKQSLPRRVR